MSTVSSYEQQAIDFLNATNTNFKSEFLKFDYHFDDKHKRNIFKCTLSNEKHKYSFEFGSSLNDSLKNSKDVIYESEIDFYAGLKFEGLKRQYLSYSEKISIDKIKENWINSNPKKLINKDKAIKIYNDFKKDNTSKYSHVNILSVNEWINMIEQALIRKCSELAAKNFGEGVQKEEIVHPTAYDVLACLQKYDCGSFEDFCSEFGYYRDSRKAYKTYKAVLREWKNVEKLFTPEQLEQLQEIQ